MPYHIRLRTIQEAVEAKFDLTADELEVRILEPYGNLRPIVLGGRTFPIRDLERVEIFETPYASAEFSQFAHEFFRRGDWEWSHSGKNVRNVSDDFILTPTTPTVPERTEAIELLCTRFHIVAMQLRERHSARSTLDVNDEYDVQDLTHALLRIFFEDVRKEEWTPSYAGRASRMDFFLPAEETVVETKKTRVGLTAKEVGDELIEDIARYKSHPGCRRLICFVYDPEGRVANPRGIERDLARSDDGLNVKAIIAPKGY
jgi:hypothetical protein